MINMPGKTGIGFKHRSRLHHLAGIEEVVKQFGEEAREVARRHIISDLKIEEWTEKDPLPKDEADYKRMGFY